MSQFVPLGNLLRGQRVELSIYGCLAVFNGEKTVFQLGDGEFPARSLLKPFQLLATGLDASEWANGVGPFLPALGSISADADQIQSLRSQFSGLYDEHESKITVPPCWPMDEANRSALRAAGAQREKIYNPCFSKHMAIAEACKRNGWSSSDYTSKKHPYHEALCDTLLELLELDSLTFEEDGCGLPTPNLTLGQLARLFQILVAPPGGSTLEKIRDQMIQFPRWIGGPGRLDTKLMESNAPNVIAKEGADGLLAVGIRAIKENPNGLGIVIKLAGGYQPQLAGLVVGELLKSLGLSGVTKASNGHRWKPLFEGFQSKLTPIDISPLVSPETAVFPGDKSFARKVSLDTVKGDHLTLSSCETTLHIGAHVDAPSHFRKGGKAIDGIALEKYLGHCQVIGAGTNVGELVKPMHLEQRVRSKRVLLKTNSYPDPKQFNETFAGLSPELIHYLGELGVELIGVDTPSLDPANSKTLEAHHATLEYGMAILEGIVLAGVPADCYTLTALPLRLKEGDASPVRAVLQPF